VSLVLGIAAHRRIVLRVLRRGGRGVAAVKSGAGMLNALSCRLVAPRARCAKLGVSLPTQKRP
jgi:hypothetical protein